MHEPNSFKKYPYLQAKHSPFELYLRHRQIFFSGTSHLPSLFVKAPIHILHFVPEHDIHF